MTEAVTISLIANATTVMVVVLTRIWSYYEHVRTAEKIEEIHKATNSMKDELVAATQSKAFAEGVRSEKEKPSTQ